MTQRGPPIDPREGAMQLAALVEADKKIHVNDATCVCFACSLSKTVVRMGSQNGGGRQRVEQVQQEHRAAPYDAPAQQQQHPTPRYAVVERPQERTMPTSALIAQVDWLSKEILTLTATTNRMRVEHERVVANLYQEIDMLKRASAPWSRRN